jgi:hypothetical protein
VTVNTTAYAALVFSASLNFNTDSSTSRLRLLSLAHTASAGASFDLRASLYAAPPPDRVPTGFPLSEREFTVSRSTDGFSTVSLLNALDLYGLSAGTTYALVLSNENAQRPFSWRYCAGGGPPVGTYGVSFVSLKYSLDEGSTW